MQIAPTRPSPPKVAVAAYLDGTASAIETNVLKGRDQFVRADQSDALRVELTGTRLTPRDEKLKAAAYLAGAGAVVGIGVATALLGAPDIAACVGMAAIPPAFLAVRHLQAAFTAPDFDPGQPSPAATHAERLLQALQKNAQVEPESQKVAYISGHGSHKAVAGLSPEVLGKVLQQSPVDLTVLDACSTAQIEVLSQMAPFAGLLLCSVHPVPGKGFPIEKMFESKGNLAETAFQEAKLSTGSLSLIDSGRLQSDLLPALDVLGRDLAEAVEKGQGRAVKEALVKSPNPDLFGARVELRSFLENLAEQELGEGLQEAVRRSQSALSKTVLQDTGKTLTFRLDGIQDSALPKGWQSFIDVMDLRFKPLFMNPFG